MTDPTAQRLADTLELMSLPARYSAAIDGADWAAMLDCLTPDAVFVAGDARFEGAEPIRAMTEAGLAGLDSSQHFISNVVVHLDEGGDAASVTSYLQAQHVRASAGEAEGITFLVGGVFRDRAVREAGGPWRFAERTLDVLWSEGNPAVHA